MRGYSIAVEGELRLTAPGNAGRLVLTSDLNLVPEAQAQAPAAAPAPAKPARPSAGSASAAPAPAVVVEDAPPAPSCFERVFGCFKKA
jgi:hypothetical protein